MHECFHQQFTSNSRKKFAASGCGSLGRDYTEANLMRKVLCSFSILAMVSLWVSAGVQLKLPGPGQTLNMIQLEETSVRADQVPQIFRKVLKLG